MQKRLALDLLVSLKLDRRISSIIPMQFLNELCTNIADLLTLDDFLQLKLLLAAGFNPVLLRQKK